MSATISLIASVGSGYAGFVSADNPNVSGPIGSITPTTVDGNTIGDIFWAFASHGNSSVQLWIAYTGTPPPDSYITSVTFTGDPGTGPFNLTQGTSGSVTFLQAGNTGTLYKVWSFEIPQLLTQSNPFTSGNTYPIQITTAAASTADNWSFDSHTVKFDSPTFTFDAGPGSGPTPPPPGPPFTFTPVPPLPNGMLGTTILSYLYQQYADDDDLQAFVAAYNQMTQVYVTWFQTVSLPYYPGLTGPLLNWVGLGLYGLPRTSLQASSTAALGMLNTEAFNTNPLNSFIPGTSTFFQLTDDVYQRILTWDFFKGDGKRFCMRWLKRRIMRFLVGVNGIDPQPQNPGFVVGAENTAAISAKVLSNVLTVSISQSTMSALAPALTPGILQVFQEAFQGQALDLPAQFSGFVCNIAA
jgi:hypothetical protein